LLFSVERKAFLLRVVNKGNNRRCQGWLKHLQRKDKGWSKECLRGESEKKTESEGSRPLLTGSRREIGSF